MPTTVLDSLPLSTNTATWLRDQGVYDDKMVRLLKPSDVEGKVTLGDLVHLRSKFPNLVPGEKSSSSPLPLVDTVDGIFKARDEVLQRLIHGDVSPGVTILAEKTGVSDVVVGEAGDIDLARTKEFLQYCEDGSPRPSSGLWKDCAITPLSEYIRIRTVRRNPLTGMYLQGNADEYSEVPWGDLSVQDVALVAFAQAEGLLQHVSEEDVFECFKSGQGDLVARARRRLAAKGASLKPFVLSVTAAAPVRPVDPAPSHNSSPQYALYTLLLNIFSVDELRRFIQYSVLDGSRLLASLPGSAATPSQVVFGLCDLLKREGLIGPNLFDSIEQFRPARKRDIQAVRNLFPK